MANKFTSWLTSQTGRGTVGLLGLAGFSTALLGDWLPNTYFLPQVQQVIQHYKDGFPVPVPTEVRETVKVVSADMKLEPKLQEKLSLFTVYGFDMFNGGKSSFGTGAIVGIPISFSYKIPKDIDKKNIMVGNKAVHWTSPDGLSLESALLLSESAQKFAIAREIASTSTNQIPLQITANGMGAFLFIYLSAAFNKKTSLFTRPVKQRAIFYSILGSFTLTLWLLIRDFMNVHFENSVYEIAGSINEDYARGAVEYYSKILQRNVALRSLLGEEGADIFTPVGNNHLMFRTKHQPYTARRDAAILRLKKLTLDLSSETQPVSNDSPSQK